MRKLKVQVQITVDGYIGASAAGVQWQVWGYTGDWGWDQKLRDYHYAVTKSFDTILLGWEMADGFIDHWAGIAQQKDNPQSGFAANINAAQKVVFSHRPRVSRWPDTMIAQHDLVTEVKSLKQQEGKDIIVYGGATFVSGLIDADLIDEYLLFVNPAALGEGKSIFHGFRKLRLLDAQAFECGVAVLRYARG